MHTASLLKSPKLISDQVSVAEIKIILTELETLLVAGHRGSIVEFGCYVGTTSIFIQRLLSNYDEQMQFHVYDSFEGLPDKTLHDRSPIGTQFIKGELSARKRELIKNFRRANLKLPVIHKAWFSDLQPQDVPNEILFAYLDGDYYESIRDSLHLIESQLLANAVIVVDDYTNQALPGASRAVDEWVSTRPHSLRVIESLAIIHLK